MLSSIEGYIHALPFASLLVEISSTKGLESMQDSLVIAAKVVLLCMLLRSEAQLTALAVELTYIKRFYFLLPKITISFCIFICKLVYLNEN